MHNISYELNSLTFKKLIAILIVIEYIITCNQILPDIQQVIERLKEQMKQKDDKTKRNQKEEKKSK